MNIRLLRRIQKAILKRHRQFDMSYWFTGMDAVGRDAGGCGTAGCIAGWAVHLHRGYKTLRQTKGRSFATMSEAAALLELDQNQARSLFFDDNWPSEFKTRYINAKTSFQAARAAASRIDHFIKTWSKE